MKKIYLFIISLILFIPSITLANSIDDIKMDIYIDNEGIAHVTEVWNMNVNEGTEGYKPYYNLGESEISNFKVTMNDRVFTYNDNWDTSDSFNNKAYHNGINYLDNGLELCFGISSYGSNTYTLTYDISNFVINTNDGYQMVYWTLFPYEFSPNPGRVYIKIHSDFRYEDTLDVWGYGKYGAPCYVYDGYIEMDSESTVNSSEYMTILIKFPEGTFNTNVTLEDDFDNYLDMANDGATAYKETKRSFISRLIEFIFEFIPFIFVFGISILSAIIAGTRPKYGTYRLKFGDTGNKVKDVLPFRDIPYKMDELSKGYWVASQYNQINRPTDYLGAILLKWLKLGKITLKKEDSKKLLGTKENTSIIFNNCEGLNELEIKLYSMMYEASVDGILVKNEFTKWCKKHYNKILDWFNDVIDSETVNFINEGKLEKISHKKCNVNPIMMEEAKKVAGLKKFLNEFSNIKDRNAIEVNLWEEYLMYANIFGIAKKVMKEFKDLYPEVITDELYNDVTFIYMISDSGVSSATTARERAQSYSSGGGGFSSGGGGGGSFGGGGGGGGIR